MMSVAQGREEEVDWDARVDMESEDVPLEEEDAARMRAAAPVAELPAAPGSAAPLPPAPLRGGQQEDGEE